MSNQPVQGVCRQCGQPVQPGLKFCTACGTAVNSARPKVLSARLIICIALFVLGIIYTVVWVDIHNWYMDLINDYGSHIYTDVSADRYEFFSAVVTAAGIVLLLFFHDKGRNKAALIAAGAVFVVQTIMVIAVNASEGAEIYAAIGFPSPYPAVAPIVIFYLGISAILVGYALLDERLGKKVLLFPAAFVVWSWFWGGMNLFMVAAGTVGMLKAIWPGDM